MTILFDDGYISSRVISVSPTGVLVQIENGGAIRSGKGVNIPNFNFDLPHLSESDMDDIRSAAGAMWISLPSHLSGLQIR